MNKSGLTEEIISAYKVAPNFLVSARSHLIDRFVPECEVIALPEKEVSGGKLLFGCGPLPEGPDNRGRLERLSRSRRRLVGPEKVVVDLRRNYPQNWAHFLNNHLPLLFHISAQSGVSFNDILGLLPSKSPNYILAAAQLFGLQTWETDEIVEGEGIIYDVSPWIGVRPARADWVRRSSVAQEAMAKIDGDAGETSARIFLSRRGNRVIENDEEIVSWLKSRGFSIVFPEELDVARQFQLFRKAEIIVATTGAGLAPLLYAHPGGNLKQLVELMPVGLMTDVYRVMADQVGCNWIGVRGRIKSNYVPRIYDFGAPMEEFSFDSFFVDPSSLEKAFEMAGIFD